MLNKAKRVWAEDRTSEVPVHIIHHILCGDKLYVVQEMLVDQSLRSHIEQNLHIEQFILTYEDPKVDSHLDTWIELAVKLNVTVLWIHPPVLSSYSLPDVIYDAKKLKTMLLRRCKFEFDISTTHVRFYCLEALSLINVHISDAQLQRLINRSPSIRTPRLLYCQGISKLHVFGLVHLKNLIVVSCKLNRVIVQAPNLQCFRYAEGTDYPCHIVNCYLGWLPYFTNTGAQWCQHHGPTVPGCVL
ncbi:hypothetical protein H5410_062560 [Solanum commersonii]|uniref:At1g61320/AtMIF1 LRR domain-containing protein n=1 Tax=Solanum commersonii TaxID=4109 RepID=A0A9J5WB54_SOLCO|nr:hypothetical protein H5410_062560 [Solanum commersonii]